MWFFLLLHLALLSTLKSDVKHLFGISCMIGCTILLGILLVLPGNWAHPTPRGTKTVSAFLPSPGEQAAVWGCPSRMDVPCGQPCARAGRQLKPSTGLHIKQDSNAEASLYNEIWDSDHRNITCWKPQLSRVNTCPHSLNLSATHSCCSSSQHSWVCAERKYYSQILQLFFKKITHLFNCLGAPFPSCHPRISL